MNATQAFRDDDAGYLAWLAAHPSGYVVNILRGYNVAAARVHRAECRTISGAIPKGKNWTGPYIKVCADHLPEIEHWASENVQGPIQPCGIFHPGSRLHTARPTRQPKTIAAPSETADSYEICGPTTGRPVVEAWTQDYIRFERLPQWQKLVRNEIRSHCQALKPTSEQVLHATFFGSKLVNADVENLVLYNIGTFGTASRNGIRFEYGASTPPASSGKTYPFGYRYALTARSGDFDDWRKVRTLASFDWVDLGAFAGEKKLAQTWLALAQARDRDAITVCDPARAGTTFAVRLQVRAPAGISLVWGGLVKGIFDGVICAFQAHTDESRLAEAAARLAHHLPARPQEIVEHLTDQRYAVLGAVPRLVTPYQSSVKWDPVDHMCVAGELLSAESVGASWSIRGSLVEVTR